MFCKARKTITMVACLLMASAGLFFTAAVSAKNPYRQPDNTWISISGTIETASADKFVLDYGPGAIIVEMDDGDRDADAYKLLPGDRVTVSGLIDEDLYEMTTIEASSVYVEKVGTTFYSSAVDEEDYFANLVTPVVVSEVTLYGTVISVSEDAFTLNTGSRSLTIDVSGMSENPLDDEGYQRIEPGDVVKVTGALDTDFFDKSRLEAASIATLLD